MNIAELITEKIKTVRKRLLYHHRYSSDAYLNHLRRGGARIDKTVQIVMPETVFIDATAPYMIDMGKNVFIAGGVTILTHDACWMVLKAEDGMIRGHVAPVKIGNNVFIGMNSTILCGVRICDNVIISANSLVASSINEPGVYAGNPARLAVPLEQYSGIREARQLREAYQVASCWFSSFKTKPPKEIFSDYFWLFEPRKTEELPERFLFQMRLCGNFEKTKKEFLSSEPEFSDYDEFWDWCMEKINREK